MKHSLLFKLLVVSTVLLLGAVGCKPKLKSPTPIPAATTRGPGTTGPEGPGPGPTVPIAPTTTERTVPEPTTPTTRTEVVPEDVDPEFHMRRDTNFFKAYTVYFDFDKSNIKSSERSKIEAVAKHLKDEPTHKVKIEGNCDERGTEGYNLALGERRALAIRKYLIDLGIASDRIGTISYGESRPVAEGHNEAAWKLNRRGDFVLLLPL